MQVVSQHLTLQLNQDNYDQVFNVYLDNLSREMVVNLYHDGVAYVPDSADTAELWITFKTGEVTKIPGQVVSGQVKVLLTETSAAVPGLAECRIVMIKGTQQLSSGAFTMAIGESIASDIELLKKDYSDVRIAALAIQQLIADESEIRTDITSKHEETLSAKDTAVAAKNAAQTAASSAEASETAAATSKTGADSARDAAVSAKNAAQTAASSAESSKTAAATSASDAESSKTAAAQSASAAATSKTGADSARDAAVTAKNAAEAAAQAVQPWKPSVSSSGDLSWAQSTDLTPPTAQNIKGPKGDPGASSWGDITDKPTTFPPSDHNHDTAYAAVSHDHDSAYLGKTAKAADSAKADAVPWSGITGKPTTFPPATHNHDSAYAAVSHDHDSVYSPATHNHDDLYKSINFYQTYMPTLSGGTGTSIQFWKGTQVQYDALSSKNAGVLYIIIEG